MFANFQELLEHLRKHNVDAWSVTLSRVQQDAEMRLAGVRRTEKRFRAVLEQAEDDMRIRVGEYLLNPVDPPIIEQICESDAVRHARLLAKLILSGGF